MDAWTPRIRIRVSGSGLRAWGFEGSKIEKSAFWARYHTLGIGIEIPRLLAAATYSYTVLGSITPVPKPPKPCTQNPDSGHAYVLKSTSV